MENHPTVVPRICAIILDSILLLPLAIIDQLVRDSGLQPEIIIALLFIVSISYSIYFITMHKIFGQTVGKMLMKVKVLSFDESPIKFWQTVVRDLPQILLVTASFIFENPLVNATAETNSESLDILKSPIVILSMMWGIADIICFFTSEKHRALHDFIAGTVVVKCKDEQ
jgi:uncharacterized RDD family membrane protein YckC